MKPVVPYMCPVDAAAVILPQNYHLEGLNDSKQMSEKKREELFPIIKKDAVSYGIGIVDNKKIDEINIYEASRLAMMIALDNLEVKPDYIITDAMPLPKYSNSMAIIKGDAKSASIAASSVIAKVTRDHIMNEIDSIYPMYNFKKHKGYPTKEHLANLEKYGILDIYRLTYKPVAKLWRQTNEKNQQKQNI